ncbi:hypothetical protein [Cellulomonas sp. Root485]|uniref:hypothetical protein n=1 Tax=Cellulomonas sp. Root485 TaxID=1736546 RepID=UPI000B048BD1|nr:hypothetical protein [Cellulomonas sp. Root485]
MDVVEAPAAAGARGPARPTALVSPFSPAVLSLRGPVGEVETELGVLSPFGEAMAGIDEADLEAGAYEVLRAELEDEDFLESLEALGAEVAGRHLASSSAYGQHSEALALGESEATQWMESVAAQADRLLGSLETQFQDRPAGALTEAEIDAAVGFLPSDSELAAGPLAAQELFLGKLVSKVKKVVKGVGTLVKKGVRAVGKLLPLGKLFGILKKLVRPLLQRVLKKAIGTLPASLRPAATRLAAKFGGAAARPTPAPAAADAPTDGGTPSPDASPADAPSTDAPEGERPWSSETLVDEFDAAIAEAVLAPNESVAAELVSEFEAESAGVAAGGGPVAALDAARETLARQLVAADPRETPLAEMEQFVPVVMAAMKLIKLGVKVIGRPRVVAFVAKLLATLVQPMIGAQAAQLLSRPVADVGLRLLGLEAEGAADGSLGAEALVATVEDTVREVLSQPAAASANELLLEALVQEAFTEAATRHLPAEVLRAGLVEAEATPEGERGIWVPLPRQTRPHYRYRKLSVVEPVVVTRASARSVTFTNGETLEDRLLEAGARAWPVTAEVHQYELLPGGSLGHLAAFELEGDPESYADAAQEFEQLAASRPLPVRHPAHRPAGGPRVYRVRVRGLRMRRRRPFSARLDLTATKPVLRLHLHVSERNAHLLVGHLEKREHVQVVALVRGLVGPAMRQALTVRLRHMLARHAVTVPEGGAKRLADALADAVGKGVAEQLSTSAAALTTAAKDPAPGVTLTFAFTFAGRPALASGTAPEPVLSIRAGEHRG